MKRRVWTIVVLLAVATAVQAWCIARAVVPAQDVVRFTRVAEAIGRDGLLAVLRTRDEQPLFPTAIWLTHSLGSRLLPARADLAALSAQLVAAAAIILTVVPLYGLLACLVRRRFAVTGTLFFCVMSGAARLGADGLSDSLYLLFLCGALWAAVRWFRRTSGAAPRLADQAHYWSAGWLFLAGVLLSVAAVTRKEGILIAPPIVFTALWMQRTTWRRPWREVLSGGLHLAAGLAIVLVPYLAASDSLTPRCAIARLLGQPRESLAAPSASSAASAESVAPRKAAARWRTADGRRMAFDKKDSQASIRFRGYAAALAELARELPPACDYWIGGLAVFAAWQRRRCRLQPSGVLLLVCGVIYLLCLIHFAARSGYLSSRHLIPIVLPALGLAGSGAHQLGRSLRRWRRRIRQNSGVRRYPNSGEFGDVFARSGLCRAVVLVAALGCLPRTLAPLHASRQGHREAAQWLNDQGNDTGAVLDTRGFAGLLAGRKTYDFEHARQALRDRQLGYLVVERRELEYDSQRGQTLRELVAGGGVHLASFATEIPGVERVDVYEMKR